MTSGASVWHWVVVAAVILLLFGRGHLARLSNDAAAAIRAFRTGDMREVDRRAREQEAHDRRVRAGEWKLWLVIGALSTLLLVELAERFFHP